MKIKILSHNGSIIKTLKIKLISWLNIIKLWPQSPLLRQQILKIKNILPLHRMPLQELKLLSNQLLILLNKLHKILKKKQLQLPKKIKPMSH
jgi:hypothetical protein